MSKRNRMAFPVVTLESNPLQDFKNYVLFLRYSEKRFLPMFYPSAVQDIVKNHKGERVRRAAVKAHIEKVFEDRAQEIRENITSTRQAWRAHERSYFSLMAEIFKQHTWPKGKYVGYASIFLMYPRDTRAMTFHFSAFDPEHALKTIAHEMTHFIFFNYIKKLYGIDEGTKLPGRGDAYVWNVSEVFNLTLENWSPYRKIFKTSGKPYEPMHAMMLPRMQRIWKKNQSLDYLLRQYFGKPK